MNENYFEQFIHYLIEYQKESSIPQHMLLMVQVYQMQRLNFKNPKINELNCIRKTSYDRANFKSFENATLGDKQ